VSDLVDTNPAPPEPIPPGLVSSDRRWSRWWVWTIIAIVVIAVGSGVFVWVEHARSVEMGEVSPGDGVVLADGTVILAAGLPGYEPGRGVVTLSVDDQPVPAADVTSRPGRVEATVSLSDGSHTIRLDYFSSNIFSRHLSRAWSFTIDTTAPTMTIRSPSVLDVVLERDTLLEVDVDEPATLELHVDGQQGTPLTKESEGHFTINLALDEGEHFLTLIAIDSVGNCSSKNWQTYADYAAPVVTAETWLKEGIREGETWDKTSAEGTFVVGDALVDNLTVTAALNGAEMKLKADDASDAAKRTYSLSTGDLAEGKHELVITARDRGGHETVWKSEFVVDTVSSFGRRPMTLGAVGEDVNQLQTILARRDLYKGSTTGIYDQATAEAVAAYNSKQGLAGGQTVTMETAKALAGSIRIDISERKLYHYTDGALRKTYPVAVGMAAYPTPTGSFQIISKVVNPTWTPPNSDWARGMDPVPPGPGNPLGTRWMGLNSPSIGIHGTYTGSSIGTAASHGCIRMRISDAEELFSRVFVGTPVEIVR
jgi:lipoprotein-anchoring transpeptidase ErfK/SrfK